MINQNYFKVLLPPTHVKIAIIGGSIAGLEAAIRLGEHHDVVVFEEHEEIGEPLKCAEGWATCMGIEPYIPGKPVEKSRVAFLNDGLKVSRDFVIDTRGCVEMIDRPKMEKVMAKKAEKAGCEIVTGRRVGITELCGEYDIIIDASGYPSQWCREFGGKKRWAVAIEAVTDYESEELLIALHPSIDGYFWIFPKARGGSNIGVGYFRRKPDAPLRKLLDRFISDLGAGVEKYTAGLIGCEFNRPFLRFCKHAAKTTPVALVGDAAGMVDIFVGEGMTKAVIGSRILSHCILTGRIEEYERKYMGKMRKYYTLFNLLYFKRCRLPSLLYVFGKLGVFSALFRIMKNFAMRDMRSISGEGKVFTG